ncbi:hypothetical protein COLO4_11819 [Corchorus olitorius]|uniref:Uncharacterized protein n=1 Tax=Corchorus olitorius TaxID=93759 RepID=A0A1R3K342_9ROSI|nr:hypothetical protein COLO4_11819 [Corchorus olitorius]
MDLTGELIEPSVHIHCPKTPTNSGMDPNSGRREGKCHPKSHNIDGDSNGLGTENNQIMGKLVERSQLGDSSVDADNGTLLPPCGSPRISTGEQQIISIQDREQSQCKSFARLRKILENARGAEDKDTKDRILLPSDAEKGSSRVAPKSRPKGGKNTKRSKSTNSKHVNNSVEL